MKRAIGVIAITLLAISPFEWAMAGKSGGGHNTPPPAAPPLPIPESNPLTPEKINLGERLFRDRNLSDPNAGRSRVSCEDCHSAMMGRGFSDGQARSDGVYGRLGKRNSPTVFDTAYLHSQFWDGRAQNLIDPVTGEVLTGTSLEAQALMPIEDPLEMNNTPQNVVDYVLSAYSNELLDAFPEIQQYLGTSYETAIVFQAVGKAIASFERTILTFDSPYDDYVAGNTNALSAAQVRGLELFEGKGQCSTCHIAPYFTDALYTQSMNTGFHNLGVFRQGFEAGTNDADGGPLFPNDDLPQYEGYDLGRYYVTGDAADIGRFKTPTLRQLTCTAPYFHNGKYYNLRNAVEFVVSGTVQDVNDPYEGDYAGTVEPVIQTIRSQVWSSQEIDDLTAFLEALSGNCHGH